MEHIKTHLQALAVTPEEKTILRDFEDVELTQEEIDEALRVAKKMKLTEIRKREYWEKITADQGGKKFTAEQLFMAVENSRVASGRKYTIDNDNRKQVEMLCHYFAGDPEFEKMGEGFSLNKGILLQGGLGVGKTNLMSLFFQNQRASYAIVQCGYIENKWVNAAKDDLDPIKYYSELIDIPVNSNPYGHKKLGICLDDLGTETSPSKRFGEEKNVIAEVLMNRYAGIDFRYTHVTTNLSSKSIEDKYGDRLRDRFREMFNRIVFDSSAKSRRV